MVRSDQIADSVFVNDPKPPRLYRLAMMIACSLAGWAVIASAVYRATH